MRFDELPAFFVERARSDWPSWSVERVKQGIGSGMVMPHWHDRHWDWTTTAASLLAAQQRVP